MKLTTAQIGRAGELLVQEQLLLHGIESAPLTTDTGIDLVAYSPRRSEALTIQVKANLRPKPGGGTGKPALDWWVPDDSPAEILAFVDLSTNRVWLVTREEIGELAQQHASGRYHFFMATDPSTTEQLSRVPRLRLRYALDAGTGRRCMITPFRGICWRIGLGG